MNLYFMVNYGPFWGHVLRCSNAELIKGTEFSSILFNPHIFKTIRQIQLNKGCDIHKPQT